MLLTRELFFCLFFFFQAEDGIRDKLVTGVQTLLFRSARVDDKMPFMEHLGELRVRIMRSLIALLIGLGIAFPFSQRVVDWLAEPIRRTGNTLVFLAVTEAFWVQMKVALFLGLFIAAPAILWQVWRFVEPGLHTHEKKYAVPFVVIGSLLFIGGGVFSLRIVTPNAVSFLLGYARPG